MSNHLLREFTPTVEINSYAWKQYQSFKAVFYYISTILAFLGSHDMKGGSHMTPIIIQNVDARKILKAKTGDNENIQVFLVLNSLSNEICNIISNN